MSVVSPVGYRITKQNCVAFQGQKLPKKLSSIDIAYAKELVEIKRQKKEAEIIKKLDLPAAMETVKNKIQVAIDNMTQK